MSLNKARVRYDQRRLAGLAVERDDPLTGPSPVWKQVVPSLAAD